MNLKKVLSVFLCLVLAAAMIPASIFHINAAADDENAALNNDISTEEGRLLIPFTKIWAGDTQRDRPDHITVKLYKYLGTIFDPEDALLVESRKVTADDGWSCTFDISNEPLFDESLFYGVEEAGLYGQTYTPFDVSAMVKETAYRFAIVEQPVADYTETAHVDPQVTVLPPEVAGSWTRITPNNELNITSSGTLRSIVCVKKGNTVVVWYPAALSATERQMISESIQNIQGIGNISPRNITFLSGYGVSSDLGLTVYEDRISFTEKNDWSLMAIGSYDRGSASGSASSITNTKNAYGSLVISKEVAGNAGDQSRSFDFTVILSDGDIIGQKGDLSFAGGQAFFSLKHGESVQVDGLPAGISYQVEEEDYSDDGYVTDSLGESGIIVGEDVMTAFFTNTRNAAGSLTIKKELEGNDVDRDKLFRFTVTLSDPSQNGTALNGLYSGLMFENGQATIELKGSESLLIDDLPEGISYQVAEDDYTSEGYVTTSTGETGIITENEPSVAIFTNTRNSYGNLVIQKEVYGNAADLSKAFRFTVSLTDTSISGTYGDLNFYEGMAQFVLHDGESKTAMGLPNGVAYTVTEDDYSEEGYVTEVFGDEGIIAGGDTVTATFNNTRNATGTLTVSKVLEGNDVDPEKPFEFTLVLSDQTIRGTYNGLTYQNGTTTFTLQGGESLLIDDLPAGVTYQLTEADYSQDGYTTVQTGATGTITENIPSVAIFTNTRNTYGSLSVLKTIDGNAASPRKEFTFTVTLSDPTINGTYGDMTFNRGTATFTLKGGQRKTAKSLPNGITYTVEEDDYSAEGYLTEKSGATGTISGGQTIEAVFTNTRNAEGTLTITKTLKGNDIEADKNFEFTLTLSERSYDRTLEGTLHTTANDQTGDRQTDDDDQTVTLPFENGSCTFTLKGGESLSIDGLPNGIGYTVKESDYSSSGYVTSETGTSGIISEYSPAVVAFTNIKNTYGDLKVTKTVEGNAGNPQKDFAFTVTLSDSAINGTYGDMTFVRGQAAFTLKHGQSLTARDLPNGTTYTVTEWDYSQEGYETTSTGASGTIQGDSVFTAAFTNTRNMNGALIVTKVLEGNDVDKNKKFTFHVILDDDSISGLYGDAEFKNGKATFTLRGGEEMTIKDLPVGTAYQVTEDDYSGDGYATKKEGAAGTIKETDTSHALFTNIRNTYGKITITKKEIIDMKNRNNNKNTNESNTDDFMILAYPGDKEFTFHMTLSDATINGKRGDLNFVDGTATFTLKGGESVEVIGLPNGISYTITEDDYTLEGYLTTSTNAKGTVRGNDNIIAEFVNTLMVEEKEPEKEKEDSGKPDDSSKPNGKPDGSSKPNSVPNTSDSKPGNTGNKPEDSGSKPTSKPDTGDDQRIAPWLIIGGCSLLVLTGLGIFVLLKLRKERI